MRINPIQSYNNYNQDFGATIIGNNYLRHEARYIGKKGTLEQKSLLSNFLNIIRNDKTCDSFSMNAKYKGHRGRDDLYEYAFYINEKKVYNDGPYTNNSINWKDNEGDELFLSELGDFIKQRYGQKVYDEAIKKQPECMQEYKRVLQETHDQLRESIREALALEPEHYLICGDKKIPINRLGIPDKEYVC